MNKPKYFVELRVYDWGHINRQEDSDSYLTRYYYMEDIERTREASSEKSLITGTTIPPQGRMRVKHGHKDYTKCITTAKFYELAAKWYEYPITKDQFLSQSL